MEWGKEVYTLDNPVNDNLLVLGAISAAIPCASIRALVSSIGSNKMEIFISWQESF